MIYLRSRGDLADARKRLVELGSKKGLSDLVGATQRLTKRRLDLREYPLSFLGHGCCPQIGSNSSFCSSPTGLQTTALQSNIAVTTGAWDNMDFHPKEAWTAEPACLGSSELLIMARSMMAARKALHGPLASELIHDPALDVLLALFVAHLTDEQCTRDQLATRATVAASVFGRWLSVLQQYGYVDVAGEKLSLSVKGIDTVDATIRAVAASQWHLED